MGKYFIFTVILFAACTSVNTGDAKQIIKDKMQKQEQAWNNGDIEGFMQAYWHSDSLKFIGKSGLTYGWNQTLNNYKKSYPDISHMGKLTFTNLVFEAIGTTDYLVIGKWHLTREKGDIGGYYSLLWKNIEGEWVIVADHSS